MSLARYEAKIHRATRRRAKAIAAYDRALRRVQAKIAAKAS